MDNSLNTVTIRVVIYYLITVIGMQIVMLLYPDVRNYLPVGGIDRLNNASIFNIGSGTPPAFEFANIRYRALTLLLALIATIIFTIPLSWVYDATRSSKRREHYSMIETIFLLPIIVASVVIIVQNSIALAFSLVGIVAAVRFRNTLKSPADAVFIFAALAIGLAAGVSEIGVAGVASMIFSFTALALRYFKIVEVENEKSTDAEGSAREAYLEPED